MGILRMTFLALFLSLNYDWDKGKTSKMCTDEASLCCCNSTLVFKYVLEQALMAGRRKTKSSKKKKRWFLRCIIVFAVIFICLGTAVKKQFPHFFASAKETIEAVKVMASSGKNVPFEKVTISKGDVDGGWYYQQLSKQEKSLYEEIYQGLMDTSSSIYVHSTDAEELKKISQFIFNDRPELFWCTGEMQVTSTQGYSKIQPVYEYTKTDKSKKQAEINQAVEKCFSGITGEMGEYDKIKYIFEYLVNTVDYNLNAPDNQNIYSALVGRASICAGYSRSAQYLLQKLGIECIYVTGTIPGQGAHAWNIVKCSGKYYQMDVTFGDPVFIQTEGGGQPPEHSINYDYLCCSDAEIMKNHTADTDVRFPQCTSKDLNYYKLNKMYYEEFEPNKILHDMNETIYKKQSFYTCKFANDSLYQQAHDRVLNDLVKRAAQNLLDYYGLESVKYTYVEDPVMDKITIYWNEF